MLIEDRRHQVLKALHAIKGISSAECHAIAALDMAIYDSIVIAYLRCAYYLLKDDHSFDWKVREDSWHDWRTVMLDALEGSLRYRHNEPLIVAVGVCTTLFPLVHQGAGLMAYKTLADIALAAQREGYDGKKERVRLRFRLKDVITRASIWYCAPADLIPDAQVTLVERSDMMERCTEASGLALTYPNPEAVLRLVRCVMPVRWQTRLDTTYIVPAAGT
jgi:hypothetical protein